MLAALATTFKEKIWGMELRDLQRNYPGVPGLVEEYFTGTAKLPSATFLTARATQLLLGNAVVTFSIRLGLGSRLEQSTRVGELLDGLASRPTILRRRRPARISTGSPNLTACMPV